MTDSAHYESTLEKLIVEALQRNGWHIGDPESYDRELGIDPSELLEFVKATQGNSWERLKKVH